MLARILDFLTDDFHDFSQSLQTGEYLKIDYEHLLLQCVDKPTRPNTSYE